MATTKEQETTSKNMAKAAKVTTTKTLKTGARKPTESLNTYQTMGKEV